MVQSQTTNNLITDGEIAFQHEILSGVARTFALTTPQLPRQLRALFGNAYLLCRINDTIEDDPTLSIAQKDLFAKRFIAIVNGLDDDGFGCELAGLLSDSILDSERELIAQTSKVVNIKRKFTLTQQTILENCVSTMSRGMMEFQRNATVDGLPDLATYNRYCYSVAGIVGETLTELMCDYSEEIRARRAQLLPLGLSFGLGLQMINILKDTWEDRARGVCWLPRDIFLANGVELRNAGASGDHPDPGFAAGMSELTAIANYHLYNAQHYIRLIPVRETGYRRYCLWAAGMALATLQRINATPNFRNGQQVKITRRKVRTIIVTTSVFSRFNGILDRIFDRLRRGLPSIDPGETLEFTLGAGLNQKLRADTDR